MARYFSSRELRGFALLIPLLSLTVWITVEALSMPESEVSDGEGTETSSATTSALRPFDPNTVSYEELRSMGLSKQVSRGIVKYREAGHTYSIVEDVAVVYAISDSLYAELKPYISIAPEFRLEAKSYNNRPTERRRDTLSRRTFRPQPFDPNKLTAEGFYELGCFSARQAEALVAYRDRIGGFGSLLQFRDCYLIDSALYAQMKDYITISASESKATSYSRGRTFRPQPFDPNTLTAEGFYELGCFTARQAEALVAHRDRIGGFRSELEWRDCYLIDSALWEQTKPYLRLTPYPRRRHDLNSVDSLTLISLPGIGPRTASDILRYRSRLGGYYSVSQLLDLKVVSAENYALMSEEFWCDSCKIRKIHINFAAPKELAVHPYITVPRLRKIVSQRQKRGGWKGPEEFRESKIFDDEVIERLTPYFRFDTPEIE